MRGGEAIEAPPASARSAERAQKERRTSGQPSPVSRGRSVPPNSPPQGGRSRPSAVSRGRQPWPPSLARQPWPSAVPPSRGRQPWRLPLPPVAAGEASPPALLAMPEHRAAAHGETHRRHRTRRRAALPHTPATPERPTRDGAEPTRPRGGEERRATRSHGGGEA